MNFLFLKSENFGNDFIVFLVLSGGGGWGSVKEKFRRYLRSFIVSIFDFYVLINKCVKYLVVVVVILVVCFIVILFIIILNIVVKFGVIVNIISKVVIILSKDMG